MQSIIDFILNKPETTLIIATAVESVIMPFVPVKWNGLALFIFGFLKKKVSKAD